MVIIITASVILVIAAYFAKRFFIKSLQCKYERSLLNGDINESLKLGKHYYLALDEATRKSKGVIDIDEKISEDFRAFNAHSFPTLL
jgi:hypothetical protein